MTDLMLYLVGGVFGLGLIAALFAYLIARSVGWEDDDWDKIFGVETQ